MSYPKFFERAFESRSIPFSSGVARGCKPFARGGGVSRPFFFSLLAACGGEEKGEKAVFGDTPNPGRDAPLPAPSFFEWVFQKFG